MKIRPYDEKDESVVVALWNEVFPNAPWWNDPLTNIRRKLTVQRELFLVAEEDGRVIGTAMGGFDGHRGWVYSVAVRPTERRRGVGRALMEEVERRLKDIGCSKLNLQVRSSNMEVVEFYKSLGFAVEDRISMGKRFE